MFRRSYVILLIALSLTGLLILYTYLGGFRELRISYIEQHEYRIGGIYYAGDNKGNQINQLFRRMRSIVESDSVQGEVTIVWYPDPDENKGSTSAFVGIKYTGEQKMPSGLETKVISMNGVVRATLHANVLVMPDPSSVAEDIRAWAAENGYALKDLLIETYPQQSVVYAEIPVKE